jgi:alpha/beta superfamily hydrolase
MAIRLSRDARLIRFRSTDGLELEGRLTRGDSDRAVVLCHPHPLFGGSMLTPVIMAVEQAFVESGYTALAFNFRGVGASQGSYGDGRAEVADVTGALDSLGNILGGIPSVQVVAGYSFGSVVGGRVAAGDSRVGFYLGVAPPMNRDEFAFLRSATCRIALVGGSRDEFCDREMLEAFVASLPRRAWLRVLDTDHFFLEKLADLTQVCREVIVWFEGREAAA